MSKNIVLVGFMGTGKTSTGKLVADELGRTFIDMDVVIEERAGKKISAIFANHGESHFRQLERALVQELAARENLVIATGGGVILNSDNVVDFDRTGLLVCLHADPEVIMQRVAEDRSRPLLESADKAKAIRELLAKRTPLYRAIPHGVDTTTLTIRQTVDAVLDLYRAETQSR